MAQTVQALQTAQTLQTPFVPVANTMQQPHYKKNAKTNNERNESSCIQQWSFQNARQQHRTPQQMPQQAFQQISHQATPQVTKYTMQQLPQTSLHQIPQQAFQQMPKQNEHAPKRAVHRTPQQMLQHAPHHTLHQMPQRSVKTMPQHASRQMPLQKLEIPQAIAQRTSQPKDVSATRGTLFTRLQTFANGTKGLVSDVCLYCGKTVHVLQPGVVSDKMQRQHEMQKHLRHCQSALKQLNGSLSEYGQNTKFDGKNKQTTQAAVVSSSGSSIHSPHLSAAQIDSTRPWKRHKIVTENEAATPDFNAVKKIVDNTSMGNSLNKWKQPTFAITPLNGTLPTQSKNHAWSGNVKSNQSVALHSALIEATVKMWPIEGDTHKYTFARRLEWLQDAFFGLNPAPKVVIPGARIS